MIITEYKFIWKYNKEKEFSFLIGKEKMEIIFERLPLLKYLIHGYDNFKKPKIKITNGVVMVYKLINYINYFDFKNLVSVLLDITRVSEDIVKSSLPLGGSDYLENKLASKKKFDIIKKIVYPKDDIFNYFHWKQIMVITWDELKVQLYENVMDDFILVNENINEDKLPILLTFKKMKKD